MFDREQHREQLRARREAEFHEWVKQESDAWLAAALAAPRSASPNVVSIRGDRERSILDLFEDSEAAEAKSANYEAYGIQTGAVLPFRRLENDNGEAS